jgi:hypothetical protein
MLLRQELSDHDVVIGIAKCGIDDAARSRTIEEAS